MTNGEEDDKPRRRGPGGTPSQRGPRSELEMVYHRYQVPLMTRLAFGPANARELAEDTGFELEIVLEELNTLLESGQVKKIPRSGRATEADADLYRVDLRANLNFGKVDVPRHKYNEAVMRLLATMFREALDALRAGTFESLYERCTVSFPISLDSRGLREADEVHRDLVSKILEVGEQAGLRLVEDGRRQVNTIINVVFYEHSLALWPPPLSEGEPGRRTSAGERPSMILDLIDPFRVRLLEVLMVTPRGLKDLTAELEAPSEKIRYELERLLAEGFISVLRREKRRGTAERIFTAEPRSLIFSSEEMATLEGRSERYSRWIVRKIFGAALDSIRADDSSDRDEMSIYRILLPLDTHGVSRISELIDDAVERIVGLRERCVRNLAEGEEPPHMAISHILLYESAPLGTERPGNR